MSLKTLMLGIAVAGITARLYSKARRANNAGGVGDQDGSQSSSRSQDLSSNDSASAGSQASRHVYSPVGRPEEQPTLAQPHWQQAGTGLDSPNGAERLEADNRAGSPTGEGTPMARSDEGDDLFDSSSQRGPSPSTTGLPDFTRGA
jgi:hypothetical protein